MRCFKDLNTILVKVQPRQLANTIEMLAYENFETAKEKGIKEGIKIGIRKACKELETKISAMRSATEN